MLNRLFGFQIARRDDPLANVKSVRLWASALPPNDPVGGVEAISRLLESPRATPSAATHDHLQALLELDRIALPLQARLRTQSRLAAMSDDVRQRLWRACDDLARGFAHQYEEVCQAVQAAGEHQKVRSELHGAFARMFYYVGVQTRQGLFRYEQWIPGKWRQLHAAYREACQHGVVAEAFALAANASAAEQLTPEQEYLQILLLHRINTGNLTAQQIDWAAEWLRDWAHMLRLAMAQQEGSGFWLDLGRGEGLVYPRPANPVGDVLYLEVRPLDAQLAILAPRLAAQAATSPGQAEASEQLALARRLQQLWEPRAAAQERRGERRPTHQSVHVAAGWAEIALALTAKAVLKTGAPRGYHYDDYGRLRPNKEEGQRSPGDSRRMDRDAWQVQDASESGLRIRSSSQQAAGQRPGALLALQPDDDPRWQLGIVRRLKRLSAEQTELGVEIIAANPALVLAKELDLRDTGYTVDGIDIGQKGKSFSALYLPRDAPTSAAPAASLLLQPAEYAEGRLLSLLIEGQHQDARLAAPRERTKDWVWATLEDIR